MDCTSRQADTQMAKILRTFLVVIMAFYICCLPATILFIYYNANEVTNTPTFDTSQNFANFLNNVNSCLNPLIYSKLHLKVYKAAKRIYNSFGNNKLRSDDVRQRRLHVNQPYTPNIVSLDAENASRNKYKETAMRFQSTKINHKYNLGGDCGDTGICSNYQAENVTKGVENTAFSELSIDVNAADEQMKIETAI